jgi:hypothetical protein
MRLTKPTRPRSAAPVAAALVLSVLLSACATFGTETRYRADRDISVDSLGMVALGVPADQQGIYESADSLHRATLGSEVEARQERPSRMVSTPDALSFEDPAQSRVRSMCEEAGVDALLVSRLRFVRTIYRVFYIPVDRNWNARVDMKLYDETGALLVSTTHDTYRGNTYWSKPSPPVVIADAVEGSLTRLLEETNKQ